MFGFQRARLLKQKKEKGNEAFKASRLKEAYNHYTDALNIDPLNDSTNSKLYFNRATVSFKVFFIIKMVSFPILRVTENNCSFS